MTFTRWQSRAAATGSALLLAAAFPPFNWWPLALVALVPLLLAVLSVRRSKAFQALPSDGGLRPMDSTGSCVVLESGPRGLEGLATVAGEETHRRDACGPVFWPAFRLGWQFGFVFFTATLWWIQHVTLPGMLALSAYLALYPAVAIGMVGWLRMGRDENRWELLVKLVLAAGIWAGLEWVRSVALSGFPWNSLAVPLFGLSTARTLAAWTGVIGLSGLVCLIPLGIAAILFRRGRKSGTLLFCGAALGFILEPGVRFINSRNPNPGLVFHHAALIQPNLTMEEKMSPDPEVQRQRYFDLVDQTEQAIRGMDPGALDLVVWPESAVPGYFDGMVEGGAFRDQLELGDFSLVTGADHEAWGAIYNSVAVMRRTTENRAIHPKVRLVPFGEFIPFRKEVPVFEKVLGGLIPMDFTPGTNLDPLRVEGQPFSIVPLVCFEDTIGNHARKYIRPEPQVIVNVTNDNWFHQSPATEMHFVNARWRTAELNRTLLRSANTGVTAIVSPQGGEQRLPSFHAGRLSSWFHTGDSRLTFYAKHGDLFSKGAGALALSGCGAVWWKRRNRCRTAA